MGMMTRRNVKQRAVKKAAPVLAESNKNDFFIDGKVVGKVKEDVIEITDEEVIKENQFTKTEINRMSTAELKEVAKLNGVEDADDMTGGELKKVLIDKFGL